MAPRNKDNRDSRGNRGSSNDTTPRLLAQVIQVVTELKQSHGCTTHEIVTQLKTTVRTSPRHGNIKARRLIVQVRRALRHGVYTGLLTQNAGRYAIATKSGAAKHKTGRDRNEQRGKRRRSPTKSPSRSTQGETTDATENDDSSSSDESTTQPEKRTKPNPKQKERKKFTKEPSTVVGPSKSRSRNLSESKKTSQPKSNKSKSDDPSIKLQNEGELARTAYSYGRHKRLKRFNRDLRRQQMDEDVMCSDQNNDVHTPESGNPVPDCLCNLNEERREPSQTYLPLPDPDPEPEPEPDPESTTEIVKDIN